MKHVLAISTLYPNAVNPQFGGFVARSMQALASRGDWLVTVINPIGLPPVAIGKYRPLADLEEKSFEDGIDIYRPRFTLLPKVGGRLNAGAIAKAILPVIRRIHAHTPIDVLDAQFFFPDGPAAAMIAREMGLPLSIKARGSDITFWGHKDYALAQMREAAEQATGLLSVSKALARDMADLGLPRDNVTIHYTGLDRDRFRPLDHTQLRSQLSREIGFDMPDNAPLLACIGNLIERKGQDRLIAALPLIPEARLVLVGKGDAEETLRQQARDLGLAERVHFTGSVDHNVMPLILSAADVMVLPTVNEGLANAWVESLACGTPVVTTNVGGASELIVNDVAGRLLEDRSPESIAEAVNSVLNNPPNPLDVAAETERFSWDNHAAELAAYYEKLASTQL